VRIPKNVTTEADEAKREIASEIIKSLEGSLTYQPDQTPKKSSKPRNQTGKDILSLTYLFLG
jgi:hypothetical protein